MYDNKYSNSRKIIYENLIFNYEINDMSYNLNFI